MASSKDEEAARQLANMARAARKVGPNDRVVELRKVSSLCVYFGLQHGCALQTQRVDFCLLRRSCLEQPITQHPAVGRGSLSLCGSW